MAVFNLFIYLFCLFLWQSKAFYVVSVFCQIFIVNKNEHKAAANAILSGLQKFLLKSLIFFPFWICFAVEVFTFLGFKMLYEVFVFPNWLIKLFTIASRYVIRSDWQRNLLTLSKFFASYVPSPSTDSVAIGTRETIFCWASRNCCATEFRFLAFFRLNFRLGPQLPPHCFG